MKSLDSADGCQTRGSLLQRVKDWSNHQDWEEFYALYCEMIRSMALRRGISKSEADDITQDVFATVARQITRFDYDRTRGQFRSWLSTIADRRIIDHFRKHRRTTEPLPELDPDSGLPTARVWIAVAEDKVSESDQEFRRCLLHRAEEEVKRDVKPLHFQAYDLVVHHDWPIPKVAATLGVRPTAVSLWTFRVTRHVRKVTQRIRRTLAAGKSGLASRPDSRTHHA